VGPNEKVKCEVSKDEVTKDAPCFRGIENAKKPILIGFFDLAQQLVL
jgi:hypothetical protein